MPSKRKIHKTPTPYIGGIILAGSFLLIVLITDLNNVFLNSILSYSVLIAVAGFVDDKYSVNPGTKILLQIIPIFLLAEQGLILKDIGNYNHIGLIEIGTFSLVFTIFCCLFLVNAFNYSDGLDGLISSVSIIIIISFCFYLNYFLDTADLNNIFYLLILSFNNIYYF